VVDLSVTQCEFMLVLIDNWIEGCEASVLEMPDHPLMQVLDLQEFVDFADGFSSQIAELNVIRTKLTEEIRVSTGG